MKSNTLLFLCFFLCATAVQKAKAQTLKPDDRNALLHVNVTDFKDKPLAGEVVIFEAQSSGKKVRKRTGKDGKFMIRLPKGEVYSVKYENFIDEKDYSEIGVPDEPGLMEAELTVQMESLENVVFKLDIHFETDKAIIQADSYHFLDDIAKTMQERPGIVIEVAGHTDSDGSEAHNLQLSQDRAAAARDYLIAKGIAPNRVSSLGYGEAKPVASNANPSGKAKNRRTEVRITRQ